MAAPNRIPMIELAESELNDCSVEVCESNRGIGTDAPRCD